MAAGTMMRRAAVYLLGALTLVPGIAQAQNSALICDTANPGYPAPPDMAGTYLVKVTDSKLAAPFTLAVQFCERGLASHKLVGSWQEYEEGYTGLPGGEVKGSVQYIKDTPTAAFAVVLMQFSGGPNCRMVASGTWNNTPLSGGAIPTALIGGSYTWKGCHNGKGGTFTGAYTEGVNQ